MKKALSLLLALAMMPALCGCGSIYSNYQKVENLLVIQTLGIDHTPSGVDITLASASNSARGEGPTILNGRGQSISDALERIRSRSNEQALFFSHIHSVVLGEEAAAAGIEDYLSYICRSPYMRVNMPMFIMKNCSAKEAVEGVGSDCACISDLLKTLEDNLVEGGVERIASAAEILRDDRRFGGTLVCALSLEEASGRSSGSDPSGGDSSSGGNSSDSEGSGSGEGEERGSQETGSEQGGSDGKKELTAAVAGYAIIKNGRLCGYVDTDNSIGVGFIKNRVGISDIVVKDIQGRPLTLEISGGGSEIEPLWGDDGRLLGIDVYAHVRAAIVETAAGEAIDTPQYADYITSRLEAEVSRRISAVLQQSRELQTDFLGLAGIIEMAAPGKYEAMGESFIDILPELELQITVSGTLSHTNDIKDA